MSKSLSRNAAALGVLCGLMFGIAGIHEGANCVSSSEALRALEIKVEPLHGYPPRAQHELKLEIANRGTLTHNVVGASSSCNSSGCLSVHPDDLPMAIAPGSKRELRLRLDTKQPDHFLQSIVLYTDSHDQFRIPIVVESGVASERSRNGGYSDRDTDEQVRSSKEKGAAHVGQNE